MHRISSLLLGLVLAFGGEAQGQESPAEAALPAAAPLSESPERLRAGLQRSRRAFEQGGEARVAFLGGSITHNPGWRDQVCADLARRFPKTRFDFVAAGIPSTGSTPGAFRLNRDVLSKGKVDLLIQEAAVNDSTNGRSDAEQVRGVEGIVRHALVANPECDVLLLHFVDPGKMATYRAGSVPKVIANHERVADHYGVPSLDLALKVTQDIDRGDYTWKEDFKNLHPSPFGQRIYGDAILQLFDHAWADPPADEGRDENGGRARTPSSAAPSSTAPNGLAPRSLPAPLDRFSYVGGRLLGPGAAMRTRGFDFIASWENHFGGGTRSGFVNVPMLVGTAPGDSFSLPFEGSAVGIFVAAGPDAGVLEYRIDGGPWRTQDLFTRWSRGLHLPFLYVLDGELAPDARHRLEARISAEHHPDSRGHACRIAHFAVNVR